MKKYLILALLSVVIIFLVLFANFGGFKSVEFKEMDKRKITVVGKPFEGKANTKEFGDLFKEMEDIAKIYPELSLTAVYLQNPTDKNNYSVKAFIGISGDLTDLTYENLDKRTFDFRHTIYARKKAHPLLTRLSLNIKEYAKAKGWDLNPEVRVEYYYNDRDMAVEIPYSSAISSN